MDRHFITFEGPEGSGKTSVIVAVKDYLEKQGYNVLTTREPGGSSIAEQIRDIILDKENIKLDAHAEALLFAASRSQHYQEIIKPALEQEYIVLCDRFIDSSLAYQGYARRLGIDEVLQINQFAIGSELPDVTIFIDVPPQVGLDRVFKNSRKVDRLDLETVAFHERVYEGYSILANQFSERFVSVDGTKSKEEVIHDTIEVIKTRL